MMCQDYVKLRHIADIEEQGWSLNPGRYVGVEENIEDIVYFKEKLIKLNEELEKLNLNSSNVRRSNIQRIYTEILKD